MYGSSQQKDCSELSGYFQSIMLAQDERDVIDGERLLLYIWLSFKGIVITVMFDLFLRTS